LVEEVRREAPLLAFRPILPGANGFPVNTRTLHARFRRLAQRIGAPTLRPDDLRRELAAHLVEQQVPQGLIAAFLARDRGRPVAPRHGQMTDLTCLAERLGSFPLGAEAESRALGAAGY
ncbi:MAG TPA: hypothetical protein VEI02_14275, partial [Planctomycetota bacterium]|nr:hypothetical protein [Planctomycetota bacterium]